MVRSVNETSSIWGEPRLGAPFQIPSGDTVTDVCVIGGGIAGLTVAYLLAKEGRNVVVLDAFDVGAGETSRSTAHLTAILDTRYYDLSFSFGEREARVIAESHMAAINRIEAIIREEDIDCGFQRCDGYLVAATPEQTSEMQREAEATLTAGFADRTIFSSVPLEGAVFQGPVLKFPRQAMFDPVKYTAGLAEAVTRRGGGGVRGASVVAVRSYSAPVRDGMPVEVETEDGNKIHASAAIVATHTPVNDTVTIHTKQAAYRSYVMSFALAQGALPPLLFWDADNPYHYVRTVQDENGDYLIVGGEDHKTGQANDAQDRYARLEAWTRRHFPMAGASGNRWSGQVMEPVDGIAYIGRNPGDKNIYIATGFSGNGTTYGTIAGILIRDLIDGRDNMWADIYDPARKSIMAAGEYIRENANVLACMVGDWVSRGEVADEADIMPGEGAILRDGLTKVACHRDDDGELHKCSAVCTHLNCIVQWNSGEKTWDCPCHGSRFDADGQVLNGPATQALEAVDGLEPGTAVPADEIPLGGPFPAGPIITGGQGTR
jgi:glycine/D-amino acid oxidase-like deaminating enzyme/nitrite reductase/ring-hydroxylating ferredoxin subunit